MGKVFVDLSSLLLPPNTRRQKRGAATVPVDQRVVKVLEKAG
jgi:hypothetical protein